MFIILLEKLQISQLNFPCVSPAHWWLHEANLWQVSAHAYTLDQWLTSFAQHVTAIEPPSRYF